VIKQCLLLVALLGALAQTLEGAWQAPSPLRTGMTESGLPSRSKICSPISRTTRFELNTTKALADVLVIDNMSKLSEN
jgi:hypothetical protein